ncbi:CDF family Co(II)/Ni(II) efflux transporter DmeF [Janthinobacterium sp. P210006]|uniref:CDF family Co(II)/Ni(II) efflux transporter DmeF n=1 Tax=Janthinobacterium sp. P210006 TaxID=3112939 RepID=UPI002E26EE00|nr:CDF family Co(II)/Ni(II) efflux transporter DmeF [Janthinobacterium sp. P210006]
MRPQHIGEDLSAWQHDHVFGAASDKAERRARIVMWITLATMALEIVAGWWYNSMALLADGWHMSSHALAIGLAAFAYAAARRYARDPRFAFGTWKIEVLAGYTSAILLLGVAVLMVAASVERLFSPQPIHYPQAMAVAAFGLLVNLVCALILGGHHDHGHDHGHDHHDHDDHHGHPEHHGHGEDLNMKAAYVHVLADAATSVLAIVALAGAWAYGWSWLDPVMGIAGAVLVALWAKKLMQETGKVLLDREMDHPVVAEIREAVEVEAGGDTPRIVDLHVWRVGKQLYSCALSVVSRDPALTAAQLRARIGIHEEIVHSTIEIVRRS